MGMGKIITVKGSVEKESMGITYVHEHLIVKPNSEDKKYSDYTLNDIDKMKSEVNDFKKLGGNTIVEMTPINYGRDVLAYKKIAEENNINVICCTGFHKEEFIPSWVNIKSDEYIFNFLISEIRDGIDDNNIRPGVIKIGTSYNNITNNEKRIINIVSKVQKETGLPISTHCDKGTMGLEQTEILLKNGVNPDKIILGHIDSKMDIEYAKVLCSLGVNICIDHVGRDLDDNDDFRVKMIQYLVNQGYADKVVLSGDMGKKSYLKCYNGKPGFEYILKTFRTNLLKYVNSNAIEKIMIENPKRIFTIE